MKRENYHHTTKTERMEIALLKGKGYSLRNIAKMLGRSPNTISEEVKFNSVNEQYDPEKANHKAYTNRKYSKYQGMKIVSNRQLEDYVKEKIQLDWSPEQIAGRIKKVDKHIKYASYQAIYKYIYSIYGRQIERYLRYKGANGKKYKKGGKNTDKLQDREFIDNRPKIINKRQRFGDWEGDFIVSGKNGKGALLVLRERKARYTIIQRVESRNTDVINEYIHQLTGGLVCFNSLTIDNDISFKRHKRLSALLGCPVYFCHPYHSWEKGGIENENKLIRQYVPKRSDISQYADEQIQEIQDKLNSRPRKRLNYKTPLEVMLKNKQFKTLQNFGIMGMNIFEDKKIAECSA